MNLLGSVGQLYMFVLLVLLFLGAGFAIWRFAGFLMERKKETGGNPKQNVQIRTAQNITFLEKIKGGLFMANNGWIKLAVFSFVGILVSVAILGFVSTNSMQGMNMNGQAGNIHQQHTQQGVQQTGMGNMQMQGNMNMPMNGGMNQQQMLMQMQQNMYQMQMQLNQMQQQMGMMNGSMGGNMQMQQGGAGNMGGMGMMNGMMGMGNMNSMPQNGGSMNNMQQNSGSMNNMQQNSGGMGMMGM